MEPESGMVADGKVYAGRIVLFYIFHAKAQRRKGRSVIKKLRLNLRASAPLREEIWRRMYEK